MKKTVWASVIGAIVVACALIAGALFLLRPSETGDGSAGEDVASRSEEAPVAERPDCVAGGVGGVELPCLGGAKVPGAHKPVTVVNVWAWWCEPCRAELPVLERYADNHPDYDVVGVHADGNAANGAAFLNDVGVELPSYQDDSNAFAGTLGLPGVVPITVVFRDGQKVGALAKAFETEEELERAVEEVLAGNA
ncbi:TlpA disulfide reductase family protein [Corynebacterium imitans]|uniref:TlpA family protein disulfide reductase n=1 Tax=Corynebacterium imitans TaxID=156978 RepID=UPI00254B62C6|nr:TlpA disulfide reductase family protein [Corynebacterium imitans]MDK8307460.1 TlpA disulfide reductase family protein [Corynebacterium imitans]MDK8638586.1 TlpA disulfide reductase family protein [Corynebacterium imitans]MDK8771872.1 TlpA disulfide reductase family protein [Corynebacterium imitans]